MIVEKKNEVGKGIDKIWINYISLNKVIKKDSGLIPIIKEYPSLFYEVK